MTRVKDGGKTNSGRKRRDHYSVHLIVNDVSVVSEIDRIDGLVISLCILASSAA